MAAAGTTTWDGYRRVLGVRITPITARRLYNFRANKRGFYSLWIFLALFIASLFADSVPT